MLVSHTQKLPHIGFPQKPLVIRVNNVFFAPYIVFA
jgi:hypothetical protein